MKSLRTICVLLVTALFLSAGGCNKDDNPAKSTTGGVLMPLKIGNTWKYQNLSLDSNGVVMHTDTSMFSIVRDTTIGTEKWYFIGTASFAFELLTNRSDGLWYMFLGETPTLFAKYPATIGDGWTGLSGQRVQLAATNVGVTVPAGTYSCNVYTYTDTTTWRLNTVRYFPLNVGFVRDEWRTRTPSGYPYVGMRRDLMSVTLNKTATTATAATARQDKNGRLFIGR